MAFTQIPTSVTILQSGLIGYQAISLTEFTTSAASLIAAGSSVEIAGAYFKADTDITPNVASLTVISSLTTCYLALVPSGTAGSQIIAASWVPDSPVWSTSKQGWYASAASNVRIVASMYKVASGNYIRKKMYDSYLIPQPHGVEVFISSGTFIVPNGIWQVYISGCAAGGNGNSGGGGGGGGEWALKKAFNVLPSSSLTVTIGAVGANTSVGAFTLNYGANGSIGAGGAGGALSMGTGAGGTGGSLNSAGQPGLQAGGGNDDTSNSGGGGGSYGSGASSGAGAAKGGYGGGGANGGSGGSAIIVIEY